MLQKPTDPVYFLILLCPGPMWLDSREKIRRKKIPHKNKHPQPHKKQTYNQPNKKHQHKNNSKNTTSPKVYHTVTPNQYSHTN